MPNKSAKMVKIWFGEPQAAAEEAPDWTKGGARP